jgi:hypothetical protein
LTVNALGAHVGGDEVEIESGTSDVDLVSPRPTQSTLATLSMLVMLNVARVTGPAGSPFLDAPAERTARPRLVVGTLWTRRDVRR